MLEGVPEGGQTGRRDVWLSRAPLLLAAVAICLITASNCYRLVRTPANRNPWEAIEVMEAWRSLHGLPVYELRPDGHSTHVYGALVPWVQGEIFRWVGPNNISGRVLTLASALATVSVLAVSLRGRRPAWCVFIAWAALLAVNHRTCQYFSENRPDMTAMLFGASGLLLLGWGQERRHVIAVAIGSACLVLGFFFKQTIAVLAAVPLIAMALRGRRPSRVEVGLALLPMAASGLAVLGLRVLSPAVYHYMIESQRSFAIDWSSAPKHAWDLLSESPLFLVLVGEWILGDAASLRKDARVLWLMAVLALTIPFCAVTYAKVGGAPNSMLPALLAMMAFCGLRLPGLLDRLDDPSLPLRSRAMAGSLLALLLLLTAFPHPGVRASTYPWEAAYPEVVGRSSRLPGTVVCPEDPTIPLFAKGYAGRSLFAERDTHLINGRFAEALHPSALAEIRGADYVVDIEGYWDDHINGSVLRGLGFVPADDVLPDAHSYRIWRRGSDGRDARTAWNVAGGPPPSPAPRD